MSILQLFIIVTVLICHLSAFLRNGPIFTSYRKHSLFMKSHIDSVSVHVSNLADSISFYSGSFDAKLLHQTDTSAKIVFTNDAHGHDMKLNLVEKKNFKRGDAFIGFGIMRQDALVCFSRAAAFGGKIILPFDSYHYGASMIPDEDDMKTLPVNFGKINDPDGYTIEIIEGTQTSPLCKVIMGIEDLNDSIRFYTEKMKMSLLRRRANIFSIPKSASLVGYVGYGSESEQAYLELYYKYSIEKVNVAEAITHITVAGETDVIESALSTSTGQDSGHIQLKDPNGYTVIAIPDSS